MSIDQFLMNPGAFGLVASCSLLHTNVAQALTTNSGGSWLRPTAIAGPRILRIGARVDW